MQSNTVLAFLLVALHLTMSSSWERVRLRIETKEALNDTVEMRTISTHILDTSLGKAAPNINVTLFRQNHALQWNQMGVGATDQDGRVAQLITHEEFRTGIYKLRFDVKPYFEANQVKSFYPFIEIVVECEEGQHYHIPLLLNPFGYSTYRGT